jgi:FkbM family methyltransferase
MDFKTYQLNIFSCNFIICGPKYSSIPGQNVLDYIEQNKIWAPLETKYLINSLNTENRDELIFVDVGSNSGYFTLIALKMGFKVIAIEANPIHKQYLMKSIELNNLDKTKLTYIEKFVSDNNDCTLFDGWSGITNLMNQNNTSYEVQNVTLDNIIKQNVFLKIDVEGAEPQVIRSAINSFKNDYIKYIMFELTYIIDNKIDLEQINILHFLQHNKYYLYDIIGPNTYKAITSIKSNVQQWNSEYFNCHKKHTPNITSAGTNIIGKKTPVVM